MNELKQAIMVEALTDKCLHQEEKISDLEAQLSEARTTIIKIEDDMPQRGPSRRRKVGSDTLNLITNQRNRFRMKYQRLVELTKKAVRQENGNSGPWVLIRASEEITRKKKTSPKPGKKTRKKVDGRTTRVLSPEARKKMLKALEKARAVKKKKSKQEG